jgi:cell division protein FtsB
MPASLKLIVGLFRFVRELIFGKEDQTVSKRRKTIRNIISALVVLSLLLNVQLGNSAFKLAHTIYQNKQKIAMLDATQRVLSTENEDFKQQLELLNKEIEAYKAICSSTKPTPSPAPVGGKQKRRTESNQKDAQGGVSGDTIDSIQRHLKE